MDANTRMSRIRKTVRTTVLAVAAAALAGGTALAQGPRARLSRDLQELASSGGSTPARVIVSGTRDEIDMLARQHGGKVVKGLKRGGVIEVSASSLSALESDPLLEHASGDALVSRMNANSVVATGADQVHAGAFGPRTRDAGLASRLSTRGSAIIPISKADWSRRWTFSERTAARWITTGTGRTWPARWPRWRRARIW
jgi:hypothetical protein